MPLESFDNNAPKKRLLILASKLGYQTRGFAEAAEKLGVDISFGTDRCHQLEDPWGDLAMPLHFENPREAAEHIARELRDNPPDAILALGDRPTPTAAYASQMLHLIGNPPETAEACRNKLCQREILKAAGIPVPNFFPLTMSEDILQVAAQATYSCVLKPLHLSASQGVIRADNPTEFVVAAKRIRSLLASPEIQVLRESHSGDLLVEEYIPGEEVAIEVLLEQGTLRILSIFDKPGPMDGPYFEETIYVTPSRLPQAMQSALGECATRTVRALGLVTGPVHAEFRVNANGPWVLEAAPRPIGGLCSRALRFGAARISLEELLLRHALRLGGSDLEREAAASGVMMIPVPRSGIFDGVDGMDAAEAVPGIEEIRITARLRDYLAAWPEGSSYLGFIFARANSPEEVEAAIRSAHSRLAMRFSPRLPVEHPVTKRMGS